MELYKELLTNILAKEEINIIFPNLKMDTVKLIELEAYSALKKIKAIIQDDSLDDKECFLKIEEIICLFESLGSNGGGRHDF